MRKQSNFTLSPEIIADLDLYVETNPECNKSQLVEKLLREFLDTKKMVTDDTGITDYETFKRYYDKDRKVEIIFVRETNGN